MNRRAAFLVVVVFVLGLALGGLSMHLAANRFGGNHGKKSFTEELTRELNLTPAQQTQLSAILEETRGKFSAIYEQYRPQIDQARRDGRQNIRAILTEEQLPKFEQFLQRVDDARKKKNGR